MSQIQVDLHCHSTVSDGQLSPQEVVRLAHANGCTLLALTDHDHTGGWQTMRDEARLVGLPVVSGVEVSVSWRSRTIHIVGLDFDPDNTALQQRLQQVRSGRLARFEQIAAKLGKKGFTGAFEGALALATNPEMASRTHLAQWLVQQGHVRNKQQAFSKYLGDGKSASVPHQWATLDEAVGAIVGAGGIAVIAHPMRYGLSATAKRRLIEDFIACGGRAIEVCSGNAQNNDAHNYALLAERYGLLASCGSDFHRPNDYSGGILGRCLQLPAACRPVWAHFQNTRMV